MYSDTVSGKLNHELYVQSVEVEIYTHSLWEPGCVLEQDIQSLKSLGMLFCSWPCTMIAGDEISSEYDTVRGSIKYHVQHCAYQIIERFLLHYWDHTVNLQWISLWWYTNTNLDVTGVAVQSNDMPMHINQRILLLQTTLTPHDIHTTAYCR